MPLQFRRTAWHSAPAALSLVLLGACAQTVPTAPDCAAAATPTATAASVRLMLRFDGPVAGNDPQTLARLQQLSQTCVRYAASVSPSVHAYVFIGVTDAALLRQRLLAWSAVRDVTPDGRVQAH